MSSFYSQEELQELGLKRYGENVLISRKSSIYQADKISIGSNVRIDDFCILSGEIEIGNYVHIAAYASLFAGDAGIRMEDFSGLSSKCSVYAVSDDYSGRSMTNPTVPKKYKLYEVGEAVNIGRHAIVGCNSVILPGVNIGEGTAVGSMSLCTRTTEEWSIYTGIPAKKRGVRKRDLLELEKEFWKDMNANE